MDTEGVIMRFALIVSLLLFAFFFDDSILLTGEKPDFKNGLTLNGEPILFNLRSKMHDLFFLLVTNPLVAGFLLSLSALFFSYRETFIYFRF